MRYVWSVTSVGGVVEFVEVRQNRGFGFETPQDALRAALGHLTQTAFEGIGL